MQQRHPPHRCPLFRSAARLWPGVLAAVVLLAIVLLAPPPHYRLLAVLAAAVVCIMTALTAWVRHHPAHRRAFFILMLMSPVILLSAEVAFKAIDWREAQLTAPLRGTLAGGRSGMLMANRVSNYQLIPSRKYELWGGTVAIDRNGFRSPYDVTRAKTPGSRRIMVTGGSSAFGWGVADGNDLAAFLQERLKVLRPDEPCEVINAAVPYFSSFQEANWYLHVLSDFAPDVLVVLDGRNDVRYAIREARDWKPAREGGVGESPIFDQQSPQMAPPAEPGAWLLHSSLYRRLYAIAGDDAGADPPPAANAASRDSFVDLRFIEQFARHHEMIAVRARAGGTRCVFALQPVIHVAKQLTPEEERFSRMWDDFGDAVREVWPAMQAQIRHQSGAGMVRLDLTDAFADQQATMYLDECHYTLEGNRILAERLLPAILAALDEHGSPPSDL